jgi:hypothetical protein
MAYSKRTSEIIDGLLRFLAIGGLLATTVLAPGALQVFDKPLARYFNKLDKKARDKEYSQLLGYMKKRGLIDYEFNYQHKSFNGIKLTATGVQRAKRAELERLAIPKPSKWDKKWRIVFFDIPEKHKQARNHLSKKLKDIGFMQLQKSVWIHPFPCRDEIATIAEQYEIRDYVTFVETDAIDSHDKLLEAFSSYF